MLAMQYPLGMVRTVQLRPLLVVTGTVHVAGGETSNVRSREAKGRTSAIVTTDRRVTPHRKAANVVATDYMREMRNLRILRTPFGSLVAPERQADLEALCARIERKISEYNAVPRFCAAENCVLWERLHGNRLAAVTKWVSDRLAIGDKDVAAVIDELTKAPAAKA